MDNSFKKSLENQKQETLQESSYFPDKQAFKKSKEEKDLLKNLKKEFKKGNNKLED